MTSAPSSLFWFGGVWAACEWVPGTASPHSFSACGPGNHSALQGAILPAHMASLASAQHQWFKILLLPQIHHGYLPARQKEHSLAVQSVILHQGNSLAFDAVSSLVFDSQSVEHFLCTMVGFPWIQWPVPVRSSNNTRDTSAYVQPTGRGATSEEHLRAGPWGQGKSFFIFSMIGPTEQCLSF